MRRIATSLFAVFAFILPVAAQQYLHDDALPLLPRPGLRVEAWAYRGGPAWVGLFGTLVPGMEVGAGAGHVGGGGAEAFAQVKVVPRAATRGRVSVGAVVGGGADRLNATTGVRVGGLYAYVPLSIVAAEQRLTVNALGGYARALGSPRGGALWAVGAEGVAMRDRASVLIEVTGTSGEAPALQVGLRLYASDVRWLDVSGGTPGLAAGIGFAL